MGRITFADSGTIDEFEAIGAPILEDVLGLIWHETLLTDETTLSDFTGRGLPRELTRQATTPEELDDIWDQWILARIEAMFGMAPVSTSLRLVELFGMLEAAYGGKAAYADEFS